MSLVIGRRVGEAVAIGPDIVVNVIGVRGGSVRLAIDAPREVVVEREEIRGKPLPVHTHLQSYRHYKGATYTLLYLAENSEQRDQVIAVYVSHLRCKVLVRPWSMFTEMVEWPDGTVRPRFIPITEEDP